MRMSLAGFFSARLFLDFLFAGPSAAADLGLYLRARLGRKLLRSFLPARTDGNIRFVQLQIDSRRGLTGSLYLGHHGPMHVRWSPRWASAIAMPEGVAGRFPGERTAQLWKNSQVACTLLLPRQERLSPDLICADRSQPFVRTPPAMTAIHVRLGVHVEPHMCLPMVLLPISFQAPASICGSYPHESVARHRTGKGAVATPLGASQ